MVLAAGLLGWVCLPAGYCAAPQQAKLEPFVMGYLTDITGPARYMYVPALEAYRAYIEELNARGGIKGHPVKVVVEDHKNDPARAAALAKRLILEDKVLALLDLGMSGNHRVVIEEAKKTGVPILNALVTACNTAPPTPEKLVFATGWQMIAELSPLHINQVKCTQAIGAGKGSRVGVLGFTAPGSRGGMDVVERFSKAAGMNWVFRGEVPAGTLDLTAWAMQIAQAKVEYFHHNAGLQEMIGLFPAMEKYGFNGSIVLGMNSLESEFAKAMAVVRGGIKNVYMVDRYPLSYPGVEKDIPEYGTIMQAVKKHGQEYPIGHLHVIGWVMGMITEQALNKVPWPAAPSDYLKALETTDVNTRGLLGGPIRYTPSDHHGPSWWRAYKWDFRAKRPVVAVDWMELKLADYIGK